MVTISVQSAHVHDPIAPPKPTLALEYPMNINNLPVAIVTGAGSGIGRSVAIGLGVKGFRVVLAGRQAQPLLETGAQLGQQGIDWIHHPTDIAQSDDRQSLLESTINAFDRIDVIVNNAALGTCKPLGELNESDLRALFEVNTIGPTDLIRRAIPALIKSKGCVVNIASKAIEDPFPGLGTYGCSKAAIDALTRAIHNEYNAQGVRAYTVSPGAVETQMLRTIISKDDLPTEHTLTPERVASMIIDCILGKSSHQSGSTIPLER